MDTTKHGFLTEYIAPDGWRSELAAVLHIGQKTKLYSMGPIAVERLLETALAGKLTHLWILPSYTPADTTEEQARRIPENLDGQTLQKEWEWTGYTSGQADYLLSNVIGRKAGFQTDINIIWLKYTNWRFPEDVAALQATFTQIEDRLGVSMMAHPGVMGLNYLRKVDERSYHRYFALPKDISWPMIKSVSVSAISHFPPIKAADLQGDYLYCYDRNSSQPYAAAQLKCGIGQPIAVREPEFDHLVPGFWACDIEGLDQIWDGLPLLPGNRDWLPTPLVKMAWQRGCKIKCHEAYIWPDKKDRAPVFNRWAHNLWDLRETYPGGTPEREAVKSIMNTTVGLLRRKNGQGHRDYRPDWYSLILAEERAVVWYKAYQVYQKTGLKPVGAYHDALYYCDSSEIEALTTRTDKEGVTHSNLHSLGGYKVEWRLPLCDEVKAILTAPQPRSAADRIGVLKTWGRANGYIR